MNFFCKVGNISKRHCFTNNALKVDIYFPMAQNRPIYVPITNQMGLQLIQIMGKLMCPNEQFREHTGLVGLFEPH